MNIWKRYSMRVSKNWVKFNKMFTLSPWLRHHYRRAKTITLILDNYIIHKSKQTERWLKKNPKFCLVFQPVYSPWVNHIERLWHKLHETITRNHQCRGMASLLARVKHFMDTVSPFPGNGYGTAKV